MPPESLYTAQSEDAVDALAYSFHEFTETGEIAFLEGVHPGDVALALDRIESPEREMFFQKLPLRYVLEWVNRIDAADLLARLRTEDPGDQRKILRALADDECADLLQEATPAEQTVYLKLLDADSREHAEALLRYADETAGGRMTLAMARVTLDLTVKEALSQLRDDQDQTEILSRIFVVDQDERLIGKLRLRDLAFSTWDTPIRDLVDGDQIRVQADVDQEEAARMISRYDLMALPVVDEADRLLGVITHDDALEILEEESTEDMEKLSGIGGERGVSSYLQTGVLVQFRRRIGWVIILAFLALLSGWVLHAYEEVMVSFYVLAFYLPMVVAAGGNTGAQSATMVIRAMSLGEIGPREFFRVVWKEGRIGILLGLCLGICVALQVRFLFPSDLMGEGVNAVFIAAVVACSLVIQILSSTIIGAVLPLAARACRLDPAVVASPAITTIVDVSGCVIYFSLAQAFLQLP